jgi:hypothetical protein
MLLDFFRHQAHPRLHVQKPTPTEPSSLETTAGFLSKSNYDTTEGMELSSEQNRPTFFS